MWRGLELELYTGVRRGVVISECGRR